MTNAARASPRARPIQPHGVSVSDEVGSAATVSVAFVSAVAVGVVFVSVTVVVGGVVVAGSVAVVGPSAVAPGTVSVRVESVGRVTLGRVPEGGSVTPEARHAAQVASSAAPKEVAADRPNGENQADAQSPAQRFPAIWSRHPKGTGARLGDNIG